MSFTTVAPAINLDASNTTIEDAHIEDFPEGIWVGHNQSVQSDTLANTSAGGASALTTIVHICGPNPPAGGTSCGNNTVSDVSLIGIANALGHNATNNIEDDLTNTLIPVMPGGSNTPIYGVGLYGVGDQFAGRSTRFSTSPDIRSSGTNPKPVPSSGCRRWAARQWYSSGRIYLLEHRWHWQQQLYSVRLRPEWIKWRMAQRPVGGSRWTPRKIERIRFP